MKRKWKLQVSIYEVIYMILYVSSEGYGENLNIYKASKITHDLQMKDLSNCYICPVVAFDSVLDDKISKEDKLEIFLDLLSVCDKIILTSEDSEWTRAERRFAELVKMEVLVLEENGELRPSEKRVGKLH